VRQGGNGAAACSTACLWLYLSCWLRFRRDAVRV